MNTHPPRHPDDETLFDYAAGALDAAAAAEIAHHVERCAACAGFLTAAARGGELLGATAAPMPGPAAERMHLKLADAWLEQYPPEPDVLPTTPLRPMRRERSQFTWRRRAVPVLACAVLAILAGTSYVLVDDQSGGPSSKRAMPDRSTTSGATGDGATRDGSTADDTAGDTSVSVSPSMSPSSPDAQGRGAAESDIGAEATGVNKATTTPPGAPTGESATATGAAAPTGIPSVGTGPDGASIALPTRVCIPGYDASTIVLPDGRYPMQVIEGPLGIVIVCG